MEFQNLDFSLQNDAASRSFVIALLLLTISSAFVSCDMPDPVNVSEWMGKQVTFEGTTFDGDVKVASISMLGKPVLVYAFASWCPPCREAKPKLEQLQKDFEGSVTIVGIAQDEVLSDLTTWAKEHPYTFEVMWSGESGTRLDSVLVVAQYPTFMILGKDGKLVYHQPGFREDEVRSKLAELVNE
ncbi:MAG: TlpA family protein disulfide reductase [Planctomycetes bacterium]|nr:TlpA family protein disulfide reductase [Planctomycetota bacterium]